MAKWVKRILIGIAVIIALLAFGLFVVLPRFVTVNGPILSIFFPGDKGTPDQSTMGKRLMLPPGLNINVFAGDLQKPRMMTVTETGDIVVAEMSGKSVTLVKADRDGDGVSDGRVALMTGLDLPHSVAIKDGMLYVATADRILRAPFDAAKQRITGAAKQFGPNYVKGGNHRTRTIAFGPDGWLYLTVGSSCNVCVEPEPRADMRRISPDGTVSETFATGLRNTVGFDWQPGTGALYGTDNGRDLLGDEFPNCELNKIVAGGFYGWPYRNDANVADPDYGKGMPKKLQPIAMAHGFGPHVAPLGMRFLKSANAPKGFEGAALAALHGSWNRSSLSGYKVVSLHFAADGRITQKDFITGFEKNEDVIGRPVDIVEGPDGAIYVSDDYSGTIFRVSHGGLAAGKDAMARNGMSRDPLAAIPVPERAKLAAEGKTLFDANGCAACHVAAADGTAVKKLGQLGARYDIGKLDGLLLNPPGPMPKPDLDQNGRKALAVHLLETYR